jgi:hypothetical protein
MIATKNSIPENIKDILLIFQDFFDCRYPQKKRKFNFETTYLYTNRQYYKNTNPFIIHNSEFIIHNLPSTLNS